MINTSVDFYACPDVSKGTLYSLGNRFKNFRDTYFYLADKWAAQGVNVYDFGGPTVTEVNEVGNERPDYITYAITDGFVPRAFDCSDPDLDVPIGGIYAAELPPYTDEPADSSQYRVQLLASARVAWQMYILTLCEQVEKLGRFHERGAPKQNEDRRT